MNFNFISLFPELIDASLKVGVIGQAIKKQILSYEVVNPRTFASDNHRTVDDVSYGGIDGMVMIAEIMQRALDSLTITQGVGKRVKTFYLSPQGKVFRHDQINSLLEFDELVFICGRYAGVDNRFLVKNKVEELSIGDFVLSGGELPALMIMDAVGRQIPGVLGNAESSVKDSFYRNLLEAPSFTRPSLWQELQVPEILLSGHHQKIEEWKEKMALLVTLKKRPDLLKDFLEQKELILSTGKAFSLKDLEKFYQQLPEKEKIVCGIQNVIFHPHEYR